MKTQPQKCCSFVGFFALSACFAASVGALLSVVSEPAKAESAADGAKAAQAALSRAYNDYYKAVRSRPAMTPSESSKLFNQMVAPARVQAQRAMSSQTRDSAKKAQPMVDPTRNWRPEPQGAGTPIADSAKGAQKNVQALMPPATTATPAPTSTPGVVLDGAAIPRELEFSGPKKH